MAARAAAGRHHLDGNALRTERTRSRVLAASLALFNERGEAHVGTGAIAEALGMSPGNLYYHFPNKDAIVEHLFRRFEERVDVAPAAPESPVAAVENLWLYLHLMLEAIWDYRFLYRNLDDLLERSPRLRSRFVRILDRKQETVVSLCDGLVRSGAMRARPDEIRALGHNVLVVSTYWLNFQSVRGLDAASAPAAMGQGAYHVMALVAPYLAGAARRHLDRLSRSYIE
ncbi:MAG TPA: TetR/AcrR family transcriptional regulator [Usitatibacter sp.]|nr:TetR/AcrR family transcriptional regulator [Usitatibacter sp.]